ncbi:MAG TPA: tetratricopeptide repeat protein [Blastocatellia bacterium]|nr:tetratricopeptide repeat protein [Blastocatellia bacterium]
MQKYKFGAYILSPSERLLWRREDTTEELGAVGIDPRWFDALLFFLTNQPGELITTEQLMQTVWADANVLERSVTSTVSRLNKLLEEGDPGTKYIERVPSRGHYFICKVEMLSDGSGESAVTNQPASRLPERPTRLIGRNKEIAEIERLAESSRVITLFGEAGIGKTRLLLEMGLRLEAQSQKRVIFISLADISDSALIIGEIASVLSLDRSNPNLLGAVARELSRQPSVLLLDNFEQIVDSGAVIVKELLQRARGLICLVTSRRRLRIAEERWIQLSPLTVPGTALEIDRLCEVESVQLFLERAQSADPEFELSEGNAGQVGAICGWLEGIPLAIELAALRMDEFSPAEVLERLERLLDLLVSEQRDAIPRHRSLQVAIEWSYRFLTPELQRLFSSLSIFRSSFTIDAAASVCQQPEARNSLNRLVDHSLLKREPTGNNRRFRMIEVYREFGDENLSQQEKETLAQNHANYFFNLAAQAYQKLRGAEQNAWLDRLELELHDLRAALDYYRNKESAASRELELSIFLSRFWETRGYWSEGRQRLRHALARALDANSLKAQGLVWLGLLSYRQDDYEDARQSLSEGVRLSREINDRECLAFSLHCLGLVAEAQGRYQEAKSLFTESLKSSQEENLEWLIGWTVFYLGLVAEAEGEYAAARDYYLKYLSWSEAIQNTRGIAGALDNLGTVAREEGDYAQARRYHEKSLALRQSLGNKNGISYCYFHLGLAEESIGQHDAACKFFQMGLALHRETGNRLGIAQTMEGIGRMAGAKGNDGDAARIFGAADALRIAIAAPLYPHEHKKYGQIIALIKERFSSEWQEGHKWSFDEAITYTLSITANRS